MRTFRYGGPSHEIVVGAHVLNVFSFSKAYGMMGWRVGYLLAPSTLMPELAKAQVWSRIVLSKKCFTLLLILNKSTLWIVFVLPYLYAAGTTIISIYSTYDFASFIHLDTWYSNGACWFPVVILGHHCDLRADHVSSGCVRSTSSRHKVGRCKGTIVIP